MRGQFRFRFIALCVASAALPLVAHAAPQAGDSETVQSTWKPQEIRYSYSGFTTAYNCDAAASKLKEILLTLGAHPQTKVLATGCMTNRPARNFFITITTATPVAVTDAATQASVTTSGKSEQDLIKKLGINNSAVDEQFPATWTTVDLARDRKLDLQPGDCELMEGLRDRVLPNLGVKVVADSVTCFAHQLTIQTPELTVSALVQVPSADGAKPIT